MIGGVFFLVGVLENLFPTLWVALVAVAQDSSLRPTLSSQHYLTPSEKNVVLKRNRCLCPGRSN